MQSVRDITVEIIRREGGFVNDPDDPGGATNFGVTIHTMRALGLDLDQDGIVTVADVRALTKDQAIEIFEKHYFEKPLIALLPKPLHATVFDMYVNAGGNAIKILQRMLNDLGHQLAVDGILGPKSIAAAQETYLHGSEEMVDAYAIARRNYYFRIADRRPASRKFARTRAGRKGGWIKRAEEFMTTKYHLTEEAFQRRVASWV